MENEALPPNVKKSSWVMKLVLATIITSFGAVSTAAIIGWGTFLFNNTVNTRQEVSNLKLVQDITIKLVEEELNELKEGQERILEEMLRQIKQEDRPIEKADLERILDRMKKDLEEERPIQRQIEQQYRK